MRKDKLFVYGHGIPVDRVPHISLINLSADSQNWRSSPLKQCCRRLSLWKLKLYRMNERNAMAPPEKYGLSLHTDQQSLMLGEMITGP